MFTRHWLSVAQFQWDGVVRPNNWITLIFCVLLLLLTLIFLTFRRKLFLICRALFSQRHFSLVQREGKVLEDRASFRLLLFNILTISTGIVMFSYTYIPNAMSKLPFIANVGVCFGVLLAAYVLKLLCNELYASLYGRTKERIAMNQYKFCMITDLAVILFPMLVIIQFTGLRALYYVIVVVFAILFVIWFYRLMKINFTIGRRFHFFLYFCTLEILPWLIGLKVMLMI
jgi:hypothetical protein